MGNRACILFFDRTCVSPTVNLHWHGDPVPGWLAQLSTLMKDRRNDATYAAARFVGICHTRIEGNLSLGISSNPFSIRQIHSTADLQDASPGNAGMVVVDTTDFSWRAYGGYLARTHSSLTLKNNEEKPHAE